MKEELQSKLVEILASIQAASAKASDFAMEQLPDIAQSYLLYGRVSATVTTALFLVVMLLSVWMVKRGTKLDRAGSEAAVVFWMAGCFGVAIGFVVFAITLHETLLVWLAPKVWLLQEIAGLLK